MLNFSSIQDAVVSRLDCGHFSDVARSGGARPGRNQQQKAADASSVIVSAPGSVTLAAAPALLRADNRDTVFPTPARGVVTFIPAGRLGTRSRQCPEPSIVQAVSLVITVLRLLRAFSRFWRSGADIIVFPRKCWVILTYWPLLIRSVHVIIFSPSKWSGACAFELITCQSNKVCNCSGLFQRSMLRTSIKLL